MFDGRYFIWKISTGLLIIFSIAVFFISSEKDRKSFLGNELKEIKIGENVFQAEIAATSDKRSRGLSRRNNLCGSCAMLFLFDKKGQYSFWMKEMNFDLDMIWIDNNEVVHIAKNVSHKREWELVESNREADKILEINAGLVDKLGIKIGDKIEF